MCSLCRLPVAKKQFWTIFDIWGLLYRPPFTDEGQIWCAIADPRCTFTCEISSRSVYSVVLCRRKTPIFAVFWTSAFSDVASWHQSQKVEHGCTTTNFPLSHGIKFVYILQCLHGEIGRTTSDVQKRDGQTNKQTKNSGWEIGNILTQWNTFLWCKNRCTECKRDLLRVLWVNQKQNFFSKEVPAHYSKVPFFT